MADEGSYDTIAAVYDFLVSDALLTPQGAEPFAHVEPGARVLDCVCGTARSPLASRCAAATSSRRMPARRRWHVPRDWPSEHGAAVQASVYTWKQIAGRGWDARFDVVFCVGNSLPHAVDRHALQAMAATLPRAGRLVVTSHT